MRPTELDDRVSVRLRQQAGATATEYVLLLVLIALAVGVGAAAFGGQLRSVFTDDVAGAVNTAVTTSAS